MDTSKERYTGEAKISEKPSKPFIFKLKENTVDTKHLKKGCVTADKLSDDFVTEVIDRLSEEVISAVAAKIMANKFGNSEETTITQKLLTDTVNDIYAKIREINGEPPVGLYLNATPEYFIGEEGATVNIEAISTLGIFEHIAFYVNDELIPGTETERVYRWQHTTSIDDTATIKCVATIMGMDYSVEKIIRHYNSFWLGAGKEYTDVMNLAHVIPVEAEHLRGAYDVTCEENDRFFIILGKAYKESYIRADLNGFEIPFTVSKITVEGNEYWVYTSDNTYHAGVYNIDING